VEHLTEMVITAIVPASDSPPTLGRCVTALEAADEPPDELIVVDQPAGIGPAEARNAGAGRASGEVLLFVDSDVEVHPDAVRLLRARLRAEPKIAAVFGSYDADPAAPDAVSAFRNLLHHHVHHRAAGPVGSFWAGLGAVRRESFESVGGFDERYRRPSIEDIELGARLSASGERIECDPRIQGRHLKAWGLAEMVRTDFSRRGRPWVELLLSRRTPGISTDELNLGWEHRLSALAAVVGAGALLRRRPAAATVALAALIVLNRDLYALILRRRGPLQAVAGVGLHAVHHLASAAAVPAGIVAFLADPDRD
jgi:glycosyltransferase involved in cell wall biosynthesis